MKTLAIVTVNFNSGSLLLRTFDSLKGFFGRDDVEYIFIDAGSTDESHSIQQLFRSNFSEYVREPDNGIYDAMNKGVANSSAQWVWFVNAGDSVNVSVDCVLDELRHAEAEGRNLLYSDLRLGSGRVIQQCYSASRLITGMLNHQNLIYARSLLRHGFDTHYKYCADYAHLLEVYALVKPRKARSELCSYETGGVSAKLDRKTRIVLWRERARAQFRSSMNVGYRGLALLFCAAVIAVKLIDPRLGSRNRHSKEPYAHR